MYWKKTSVLGEEKDALGSEKVKYFGTQFESYKVKYFGMEGVSQLYYRDFTWIVYAK